MVRGWEDGVGMVRGGGRMELGWWWEDGVGMVRGGWSWDGEGRGGWSWDGEGRVELGL